MSARSGFRPTPVRRPFAWTSLAWLWLMLPVALWWTPAARSNELTTSGQYILGFVRYISWPHEENIDAWHICIAEGVSSDQDRLYADENVNGKRFVVRHISQDDPLSSCHVLDLTGLDAAKSAEIILRVRHFPVLTVGSEFAFCSQGGLICLRLHDSEQKFEVNLSAVKASGLNISAKLLRLGSSVPGAKEHP
jgi:YfiR/HmsC-like